MKRTKVLKNFDKKEQVRRKEENGITLIALVITIIVLLILAAVSIATLTGENGILAKANKAKEDTEIASEEEQRQLAQINATMHDELWYYKEGVGELAEKQDGAIPIPAGFAPTQIEGENSIKDGFVITDSEGNEFVWIPCSSKEYENANWRDDWQQWKYRDTENMEWSDSQTKVGIESLKKLEEDNVDLNSEGIGFYVARYEAGIPNNVDFYADSEGDAYYIQDKKDTSDYKPVSKKGVQAWNCASCIKAKDMSKKMYENNSSINSYLIDSHAWNYICDKIITNYTEKSITEDWSSWGNYENSPKNIYDNLNVLYAFHRIEPKFYGCDFSENGKSVYHKGKILNNVLPGNSNNYYLELSTGASEKFKTYNIYDMAGNMCEFTTEIGTNKLSSSEQSKTVVRGGSFKESRNRKSYNQSSRK